MATTTDVFVDQNSLTNTNGLAQATSPASIFRSDLLDTAIFLGIMRHIASTPLLSAAVYRQG